MEKYLRLLKRETIILTLLFGMIGASSGKGNANVDWPDFLSRHDLVWERAPMAWYEGPFLGNGMLGSMVHQLDDQTIRISVGRSDVEDHRQGGGFLNKARLPNGYFTLNTAGKISGFKAKLKLYDAEAVICIQTKAGQIDIRGIVHSDDMIIAYEILPSKGEAACTLSWHPLDAIAPARRQADELVAKLGDKAPRSRINWHNADYEYNPKPVISSKDGYAVCCQSLLVGGQTGTSWKVRDLPGDGKLLLASIEHSYPESTAVDHAVAHLKAVEMESFEQLVKRHRAWWHDYYPQSFLSIEDTRMESFYWIQVYKFGAGARKGRAYMDTMGPWIVEDTAWANGWFDLNTQLSYWFLLTANRIEVAESLFTKMDECFDVFVANMPAKYEGQAAAIHSIAPQTFVSPVGEGLGFMGDFTWLCHDYWMLLERTMDEERIKQKFFPLLTKAVNYYIFNMVEGKDGKIHLPPTRSPEYPGSGKDCNFNLSLFRWGCLTLIQIAERYQIDDPLLPKWKDVVKRLVEYPTDGNGFMVTADIPFAMAHRHYSHLLMIYPLGLFHMEQPENRELIQKSLDHWTSFFKKGVTGYSYTGAAAMYALQGNGEKAASYLDMFMRMHELFPDNATRIHPTTMYTETVRQQPVTETPFSLCDSMQLMLLQSWGDTIRVFPAVPESWENISFDGLLAAGAFEVSAVRKDGITQFVRITSLAGEPCLLKTDLKLKRLEGIPKSAVKKGKDGVLQINLKKGEEVVLYGQGVDQLAVVNPVEALPGNCNSFGLK